MCTILTFDTDLWKTNRTALLYRIEQDNKWNSDGLALVCLNHDEPEQSFTMRGLSLDFIRRAMVHFAEETSNGRVFLHQRYATGWDTSLDCTHGWTDGNGRHLMHNGVIASARKSLSVDSQALLPYMDKGAKGLLNKLKEYREVYANCFVIDSKRHSYGVVRLSNGSLFTDGCGNYSTVAVGPINVKVKPFTAVDYPGKLLPKRKQKAFNWNNLYPYSNYSDGYERDSEDTEEILDYGRKYGSYTETGGYTSGTSHSSTESPKVGRFTSDEWKVRSDILKEMKRYGLMRLYAPGLTNEELEDIIDEYLLKTEMTEASGPSDYDRLTVGKDGPPEDTEDDVPEFTSSEETKEAAIRAAGYRTTGELPRESAGYREYRLALLKEIERQDKEYLVKEGMSMEELEELVNVPLHRVK